MRTINYKTDLCVVGGGMAGLCCAIAAAIAAGSGRQPRNVDPTEIREALAGNHNG